jgi:SSS family solute:Na+ symporter
MSTEATIFAGVVVYLAIMLFIGIYSARQTHSTVDFMVAGRRMPVWICAATLIATWFGGSAMMGSSGAAYEGGFLRIIADPFGGALALFVVGFFFARIFRRLRLITFIEFFEDRFGITAATVAAVASIASNIGWTAGMLVAFGFVFETLTGVPLVWGITGGAVIVFVYTAVGGMWAVAVTDFVQMLIIAIGLVVLLVTVLVDVGGWGVIAPQLPEHTFRMVPLENSTEIWLNYFRMWLIFGLADVTSQSLLQRSFSAKSEQVAQNSFYLAGFGYLTLGMIPVMLGIIASVTLPGLEDPETVIPTLALKHLHPVAIALFVGALLAAIMSTCDSALLAAASVFSTNLLPFFKSKPSDKLKLLVTRLSIPVLGSVAIYIALKVQVIFNLILDANSVVLVSVVVPFIAGIYWKKSNRTGTLTAMAVGFLVWLVAVWFLPNLAGDMLGLIACLVTILVVTPLTQKFDPPRPLLTVDGEEVALKDRLGTLPMFRSVK